MSVLKSQTNIILELGDEIELSSQNNSEINNHKYYIDYIDSNKMNVISLSDYSYYVINFDENGNFADENIDYVSILSRSEHDGYAKQNGLFEKTWIEIKFSGDIPEIITGEITNVIEDMIEITTYPNLDVVFIDFAYKGIPEDMPIEYITITQKPSVLSHINSLSEVNQDIDSETLDDFPPQQHPSASLDILDNGESIVSIPEDAEPDENIYDELSKLYAESTNIIFGKKLDGVKQLIEKSEKEQRYDIKTQVDDLLDGLKSNFPNMHNNKNVTNNIHRIITRFKELREDYSKFDENNTIFDIKKKTAFNKPLVESLTTLNQKLHWIMPVVSSTKNIYIENYNIESNDTQYVENNGYTELNEYQDNYYIKKQNNIDYKTMLNTIHNTFKPFIDPNDTNLNSIISIQNVNDNLEAVVENFNEFSSTIVNNETPKQRKYIIQKYNLGMTYLKETYNNNASKYDRVNVTNNDKMFLKSFLTLPLPVIEFSRINLKKTNILHKAVYNQNCLLPFKLLHKKTNINVNSINDFNSEIDYKTFKTKSNNNVDLLKNINHFKINNDVQNIDILDYNRYLETIIPKTKKLLEIYRQKLSNCYSIKQIVDYLEPFLIYSDDITYQQYNDMRFAIKQNIKGLREIKHKKQVLFNKLKKTEKFDEKPNKITNILMENGELNAQLVKNYIIDNSTTTSETLYKINNSDSSLLFNALLSTHMNVLNTPTSLIDIINNSDMDFMDKENKYTNDCFKRYLAKKYDSIDKLQSDNGIDIVFDKQLDDSPYHILTLYEKEIEKMNKADAISFLNENLKEKHGISDEISLELSYILYNKEKQVQDNHYALVELKPHALNELKNDSSIESEEKIKSKTYYYKRVKNIWVKDESITDLSFFDTNELFCNISTECFKNTKTSVCENTDDSINRIKQHSKQSLLDEFDSRYTINADELKQQNLKRVNYYNNMLTMKNMIENIKLYKSNNLAVTLGRFANTDPIVKSPNSDKLDKIIEDSDFIRKQNNIIRFVDIYTRKNTNESESEWWLYCIHSNIKLLPTFMYKLAFAYVFNNNYSETLNLISSSQGYEEGKYVFDKHSQWKIKNIDYAEEELYNEAGFKVTHHSILEQNVDVIPKVVDNLPKIFENENTEKIYNVFNAISGNIFISKENIESDVMMMSTELVEKEILSKIVYEKKAKIKKQKTDKDSIPYKQYYDETIVLIVASCLLVYIQTLIPSISVKRTFPGCIQSFSGYPFTGIEDLTGIKYISCVVSKIKSPFEPWNSIKNYSDKTLANRIKTIIEKILLIRSDVIELIRKKKEYLILNPDKLVTKDIGVLKWNQFLPPIGDINLPKNISNVSPQFIKEIHQNILKARYEQFDMIHTMTSKNHKFGISIIQTINNIIKKEPLLLKTVTLIPYVDNACCNDITETIKTIEYFEQKNDTITHDIKAVLSNSNVLNDIKLLSKAPILIHKDTLGSLYPNLEFNFSEETIYSAFIHYGRYDTDYDVPLEYKSVCQEKPDNYDPKLSIEEKIVFLKKNDRKFTITMLLTLLNIINTNNKIHLKSHTEFSIVDPLKDFLLYMETKENPIIEQPLQNKIMNVLNNYKPDKFFIELNEPVKKLKNHLLNCNNKILVQILDFLYQFGSLTQSKYDHVKQALFDITHWNIDTKNDSYYDNGIYNILTFVKNTIYHYSKFYPNIILNGKINNTVHKHWGLSDNHNANILNIIDDYYKNITTFIKDDSLHNIINMATSNLVDIQNFINLIPTNTPFKENDKTFFTLFDKETILELGKYAIYSCIYEYILLCDNDDIFYSNTQYNKVILQRDKQNLNSPISEASTIIDTDDTINEVIITTEKVQNIKEKVAKMILAFINIDIDNKKTIDFSYEQTYHEIKKKKTAEKNNIVSKFGRMEVPDRKIENLLKQYRLGQWDVANQKGFRKYDKNAYDNDAILNVFQNEDDDNNDNNNDFSAQDTFVIDSDNLINHDNDDEINESGRDYDFSHLGEDYNDGQDAIYSDDEMG